jgi:hypothetical protein
MQAAATAGSAIPEPASLRTRRTPKIRSFAESLGTLKATAQAAPRLVKNARRLSQPWFSKCAGMFSL